MPILYAIEALFRGAIISMLHYCCCCRRRLRFQLRCHCYAMPLLLDAAITYAIITPLPLATPFTPFSLLLTLYATAAAASFYDIATP